MSQSHGLAGSQWHTESGGRPGRVQPECAPGRAPQRGAARRHGTAGCSGASLRASPPCRNTAAGTSTSSRPTAAPSWGLGAQEEGHTGLGPSAEGGSEAGGPDREPCAGAQPTAERIAAGCGTTTARPAMNSGPEPRTPRTLFSIADILGPRMVPRGPSTSPLPESSPGPTSPLCALEELTSKTFRGLDGHAPESSEGRAAPGALGPGPAGRRRRKSRTAFTAQQVLELERRFVFQKYLAPSERDGLAARLGLANAQVVTWFQNRRAKLKRDVEEMRADVASLSALAPEVQCRLELPHGAPGPGPPDAGPHLSEEEIQVDD
ncbi:transcription factor LBX2 [Halichoerus grypus]|uniref:transcription factor LBX2 n=1 Tax=Halichoerus grypus TaxID=9711 RepID=UPI001658C7C7|nr:transcription factor LBX2 [Halichoerus grypus]